MALNRYYLWGLIAALISLLLALGLRPQAVLVETASVMRDTLRVTIEEEGKARVKDRYLVSSPVSGFVRRIPLKVGDQLQKQAVITELEPLRSNVLDARSRAEAEARVAASRSALLAAEEQAAALKADAEHAESEYLRKIKLAENSVISKEELSQVNAAHKRAQAMLRSAVFAVDVARYELDAASTLLKYSAAQNSANVLKERVLINAPVTGSVLKIYKESEGVVNAGSPLLELGDPKALEVAVDVLSFDAVRINPGDKVEISRWGGELLHGVVRRVEPVGFTEVSALGVEEQRVWVIVDIISDGEQWRALGDGYRVEASFVLWQQDAVLQVPSASVFKTQQGWASFVVNGDTVELRPVTVGQQNGLAVQIVSGLNEGETVVQHPDNQLQHGSRIRQR